MAPKSAVEAPPGGEFDSIAMLLSSIPFAPPVAPPFAIPPNAGAERGAEPKPEDTKTGVAGACEPKANGVPPLVAALGAADVEAPNVNALVGGAEVDWAVENEKPKGVGGDADVAGVDAAPAPNMNAGADAAAVGAAPNENVGVELMVAPKAKGELADAEEALNPNVNGAEEGDEEEEVELAKTEPNMNADVDADDEVVDADADELAAAAPKVNREGLEDAIGVAAELAAAPKANPDDGLRARAGEEEAKGEEMAGEREDDGVEEAEAGAEAPKTRGWEDSPKIGLDAAVATADVSLLACWPGGFSPNKEVPEEAELLPPTVKDGSNGDAPKAEIDDADVAGEGDESAGGFRPKENPDANPDEDKGVKLVPKSADDEVVGTEVAGRVVLLSSLASARNDRFAAGSTSSAGRFFLSEGGDVARD